MSHKTHCWRFFRAGGFDQVRLDSGADLLNLNQLDQKLWVALSCPTQGLEIDSRTLALVDSDADGHVRSPELIAAIDWAAARLKSADSLIAGGALSLDDIDASHEAGQRLLAAARRLLADLGRPEAGSLSVADCADHAAILASLRFNGDGVITAAGLDQALADTLTTMVGLLGGRTDRSGETGIDQPTIDRFFDEGQALVAWRRQAREQPELLPLGPASADAHAALSQVRDKVDDFFMRCRLASFDPRAASLLNGSEEALRSIGNQLLAGSGGPELATLPLAYVRHGAVLPLVEGLNPAWTAAIAALRQQVISPLLGPRTELDEAGWLELQARFSGYEQWRSAQPVTALTALDAAELEALVDSDQCWQLTELIVQDASAARELDWIGDVERLVRYVRDLARLANNFVAFTDFYTRRGRASFQAGTLYLDGRSCELCIKVLDPNRHAALATLSGVYLAYCECSRQGEKMTIAAAFTAGDADQLMVGRNGVFYDCQGRDWDATISKIVEHPISIRQAFWAPYKKVVRLAAEQAHKLATAKAGAADDLTHRAVKQTGDKLATPASTSPATPFDAARFAGIFAAMGLAVGAIGTALASVVTGFLSLQAWQMPVALAGLALTISGPSMAIAYFKLRNRNLGPILDANGWAVNTRARINIPFGTALTQTARLPEGAERALTDPYGEKRTPWKPYLLLGVALSGLLLYLAQGDDSGKDMAQQVQQLGGWIKTGN